jgi:uncharacterized membrane protein (UPF0127 family)
MRRCQFGLAAALLLLLSLFLAAAAVPAGAEGLKRERATLVTAGGKTYEFDVEIADSADTRARGLMFRRRLGARAGMLFFYDSEQHISMWMRNTYIPLDMIFIKENGSVHRIQEDTEPFSEEVILSGEPVFAVLEVNAGTTRELGLRPGDRVEHPRFGAATNN